MDLMRTGAGVERALDLPVQYMVLCDSVRVMEIPCLMLSLSAMDRPLDAPSRQMSQEKRLVGIPAPHETEPLPSHLLWCLPSSLRHLRS